MTLIDELPPDQRAVLSLVLRRGKSYAEIATALELDEQEVRRRAHAALDSLAPGAAGELPDAERAQLADFLLSQLSPAERLVVYDHLEGSDAAQAYAGELQEGLAALTGAALVEAPPAVNGTPPVTPRVPRERSSSAPEAPPAKRRTAEKARPAPAREETPPTAQDAVKEASGTEDPVKEPPVTPAAVEAPGPIADPGPGPFTRARTGAAALFARASDAVRSRAARRESGGGSTTRQSQSVSKLGGALLLGAIVVAAVVAVVLITTSGGTSSKSGASPSGASAEASSGTNGATGATGSHATLDKSIRLSAPSGASEPAGAADVATVSGHHELALEATKLPPTNGFNYVVWLYNSQNQFEALGKAPAVGSDGALAPSAVELPQDAGNYREIIITKETEEHPTHPGEVVLRGAFGLH